MLPVGVGVFDSNESSSGCRLGGIVTSAGWISWSDSSCGDGVGLVGIEGGNDSGVCVENEFLYTRFSY